MEKARADLKIAGMTCAMCVKSVENALTEVPGVSEARVTSAARQPPLNTIRRRSGSPTWKKRCATPDTR